MNEVHQESQIAVPVLFAKKVTPTRHGTLRRSDDGQFEIVYTSPELIKPDPFPKGYQ